MQGLFATWIHGPDGLTSPCINSKMKVAVCCVLMIPRVCPTTVRRVFLSLLRRGQRLKGRLERLPWNHAIQSTPPRFSAGPVILAVLSLVCAYNGLGPTCWMRFFVLFCAFPPPSPTPYSLRPPPLPRFVPVPSEMPAPSYPASLPFFSPILPLPTSPPPPRTRLRLLGSFSFPSICNASFFRASLPSVSPLLLSAAFPLQRNPGRPDFDRCQYCHPQTSLATRRLNSSTSGRWKNSRLSTFELPEAQTKSSAKPMHLKASRGLPGGAPSKRERGERYFLQLLEAVDSDLGSGRKRGVLEQSL